MGAFYYDQGGSPPTMTISNLIAGQTAQVDIDNCTPAGAVFFVWSVAGGGPVNTPLGPGFVSPPLHVIRLTADAAGYAGLSQPVPPGASGLQVWFHGADLGSATMMNPLALTIQ